VGLLALGLHLPGAGQVLVHALQQALHPWLAQRAHGVGVFAQQGQQGSRRHAHIGERVAIGVVVDGLAQAAQRLLLRRAESERSAQGFGRGAQVVSVRTHHRPAREAPAQQVVDQQARADLAVGVEVRVEQGVVGRRRADVVVHVAHPHAGIEQPLHAGAVRLEGQVHHHDLVAGLRLHPREQVVLALEAGDELGVKRVGQAPLQQRAQAVGVAVADVDVAGWGGRHGDFKARPLAVRSAR